MLAAQTHDRADKPAGAEPERADAAPAMRGAPLLPSLRPTPAPLPLALQRKLTVGDPDDAYEEEADSVAERVMRMPDTTLFLRRKCNCGGECEECGAGAPRLMRLASDRAGAGETAPPVVSEVLASPGRPLDAATREFMEPRLGLDLGGVRVHTGGRAAESARAVGALAYTVGRDIVFGLGQYAPDSGAGRKLLAHELAHVAQQSGGAPVVRRACAPGRKGIGAQEPASKCAPGDPLFVHGPRLKFCTDSDELLEGQDKLFDDWRAKASAASSVELHGNASTEGPSGDYNLKLSCHRAAAMAVKLASAGVSTPATLHAHGATAVYGDALENRNVVLVTKAPVKKEEPKGEEKQEPKEKEKEPPKGTNQLDDCKEDAGQPASIRAAVSRALGDLDTAISALAARPLTDHAKNSLFIVLRASDDATADTILDRLRKIRKGLPSVLITCDQKDKI
ncbi:MAG TPA: DUF4157 domain-containing protein, partial [Pyrinomonadaceae bacterium]|nr:DUF4157 domain-containing protein [Pyrinomonadaceae bacterium]